MTDTFDKERRRELGKRRRQQQTNWLEADKALIATSHVGMCSVEGRLKFCQITYNKGYEIFEDL